MENSNGRQKGTGLRYNKDKTRHDLLPIFAIDQLAQILTVGAKKYQIRNWERGMPWTTVLASMKRHLAAFEAGEDLDPETGLLHTAHIMCNASFITEYYKIYPQGDDRPHLYLESPKIGVDIDEILTHWLKAYKKLYNYPDDHDFSSWWVDYDITEKCTHDMGDAFYRDLEVKTPVSEMPFDPHCYVTSRNIDTKVTEEWLHRHGFPCRPVYTVGLKTPKVDVLKEAGVEIFVDDVYKNFLEINRAGICCYLFDAPHNQRYNVGHKRIKKLSDLITGDHLRRESTLPETSPVSDKFLDSVTLPVSSDKV